ncbi:MAG: carboxylating nicotinate-nucleotide diphosphorylase [Candidatus Heimdallarchaeota archaeon]|nr:MAG: carboxylating nicotinate-nucleotide diphosphorylase [Candidatus Heimdallarchaeota archaeon]
MSYIPSKLLEQRLVQFLHEDIQYGDVTSELVPNVPVKAKVISKQEGILCGLKFVKILLKSLNVEVSTPFKDGEAIREGDEVLLLHGLSRPILVTERTILNLMMRLSGIATQTRNLVNKVHKSGQKMIIASTRKTTPGFRYFEKYAVKAGGGDPHRWNLSDTVLIKENHLKLLKEDAITTLLNQSKEVTSFSKKVDIEVENIAELKIALKFSPEIIMLDEFSINDIREAIEIVRTKSKQNPPLIEISGGITEQNIEDYFIPGVDIISVGALTHSVQALDFSMKICEVMPFREGEESIVD